MSYEDGRPKLIRAAVELGLREKMSNVHRNQRLSVNEADEVIRAVYQVKLPHLHILILFRDEE
jgi:hypothetical protein